MGQKMAKRLWVTLAITFFIGIFSLSVQPTAANTSQLDQQNETGSGNVLICTGSRMMQTFKPTLNRLDKVAINVTDASGNLSIAIRQQTDEGWGELASVSNQAATDGWNVFDFADIVVTPESEYAISVMGDCSNKWIYSASNPYSRGYAIWQSGDQLSWDFQFQTFGMSVETPGGDPAVPSNDATGVEQNNATGETLGTVSTAIVKPTNLKATFVEAGATSRGVKLVWDISKTSDINGYKIFRSESATKGFLKIGEITKESFEYLDVNIAASKIYYYQVRAYKGTEQSASSNTASATTPADIGPAKPAGLRITQIGNDFIGVIWDKNTETNLAGYTITIYNGDDQVATAELAKDASNYKFNGLAKSTSYKIKLVAKDSAGKYSLDAWAFGSTLSPVDTSYTLNIWSGLLALVDVALLILLICMMAKRRKTAKVKNN